MAGALTRGRFRYAIERPRRHIGANWQQVEEPRFATRFTPCDILGDIPRPPFGRVEGDNAHRVVELAGQWE
jgi:hypothetical protein